LLVQPHHVKRDNIFFRLVIMRLASLQLQIIGMILHILN